jgi:hypothetical protein
MLVVVVVIRLLQIESNIGEMRLLGENTERVRVTELEAIGISDCFIKRADAYEAVGTRIKKVPILEMALVVRRFEGVSKVAEKFFILRCERRSSRWCHGVER